MAHHRKINLSMFRGEEDEEDDLVIPPKRQVELTDLKSKTFTHGITKKTKKDLEREAEEKKRLDEERAQALVMAEYEEAFEKPQYGVGATRGSGFVRAGGVPASPSFGMSRPFNPPAGPSRGPPTGPSAMSQARYPTARAPSPPPSAGAPKAKGKRAMDAFLAEIKGNQEVREQRLGKMAKLEGSSVAALAAHETSQGRPQNNDADSTNLFIANLPHNISEESLGLFFAKQGPVGTVKIMWPRGDEMMQANRRGQTGLTGFVAYMKRSHAEKAVRELDRLNWGGNVIRVAFSRTMPVPTRAIYDLGNKRSRSPSDERSKGRDGDRSSSKKYGDGGRSPARRDNRRRSYSHSASSGSRSPSPPPRRSAAKERWLARVSTDREKLISDVARRTRDYGKAFEENLKGKERANPDYAFLFDENIPDFHVYKLALNSRHRVPTPPPEEFNDEGYASMYSSDSAEDSEKERTSKGRIGKIARKRFESMLRAMSGKRVEIARAMEFALKHAEAADEVAELVCQSLQNDETPVPRKIARLHLVSDILHNSASSLPNVWKYRLAFEKRLPPVFAHLWVVRQSLDAYSGKISAGVFNSQVLAVLDIWERWIVFTQNVTDNLRDLLQGRNSLEDKSGPSVESGTVEAKPRLAEEDEMRGFKPSGFKSSFKPAAAPAAAPVAPAKSEPDDVGIDGQSMEMDTEDIDGDALDDDVDGEELEDVDGEALDDVDGAPIEEEEEDMDGEPL